MAQETMGTRLLIPLDEVRATGQQFRAQAPQIAAQVRVPLQAIEQTHGLGWSGQARAQYLTLHQRLMPTLEHVEARAGTLGTQLGHHASYYAVLNAMRFGGTPGAPTVAGGLEPTEDERVAGKSPSQTLGDNMVAAGILRPPSTAAHHIVAWNHPLAAIARSVLADPAINIDINAADNGVFLPIGSASANPGSLQVHSHVHTNVYFDEVNRRILLARPKGAAAVRATLRQIARELQAGTFPV